MLTVTIILITDYRISSPICLSFKLVLLYLWRSILLHYDPEFYHDSKHYVSFAFCLLRFVIFVCALSEIKTIWNEMKKNTLYFKDLPLISSFNQSFC